jgi:hypothetical protein
MAVATRTGLISVAEAVFVCSDSNYNQTTMSHKRRTPKAPAPNAKRIDDKHSNYSIN